MSDVPNIVNVVVTNGTITVTDNTKQGSAVAVINAQPTQVALAPVSANTVNTSVSHTTVVEVKSPGVRGFQGLLGDTGVRGFDGPRGYTGTDGISFIISSVTSSEYIGALDTADVATGSLFILSETGDAGNNVSGSSGEGITWTGNAWLNTGQIRGELGPQGTQGASVSSATYNSTTGMVTLELNNGDTLSPFGSVKGEAGYTPEIGIDYNDGVGIADIYLNSYNLYVQKTDEASAVSLGNVRGEQGPLGGEGPAGAVTVHSTVPLSHLQPPVVEDMGTDPSNASLKFSIPGGIPGQSAYDVWIDQGNLGDEAAFLATLKGDQGATGTYIIEDLDPTLFSGTLASALTASLWSDYQTNFTVGYVANGDAFAAGTTLETIVRAMLSQSQPEPPASLTGIVYYNGTTAIPYTHEIGTSVTIDNVAFTLSAGSTVGGLISLYADTNFGTPTLIDVGDVSPATFTSQVFTRSSIGGVTLKLTWSGGTAKYIYRAFKAYAYLGGYPEIILTGDSATDNSAIQTMVTAISSQQSILASTVNWTTSGTVETQTQDNFTYIVYPSQLPDIANIVDGNGFSLQIPNPTWTLLAQDVPIQNSVGTVDFTYNVDVYISEQERQITTLDQLIIT